MLTDLLNFLSSYTHIPKVFHYISVRAILAIVLSLSITSLIGKRIIKLLQKKQISDEVRELGLQGNNLKKNVPNMGGIIIIISIVLTTILLTDISNVSIQLLLFCTIWMGLIGFLDDYIKVFKKNKAGLAGKYKILGQLVYGLILAYTILNNPQVVVEREYHDEGTTQQQVVPENLVVRDINGVKKEHVRVKAFITTIPFVKKHEFNYEKLLPNSLREYAYILYFLIISFIIIAVSNAANLTDGLDGLLSGTSAIIGTCLGIFAYLSSNFYFSEYLNILYVPYATDMVIFCIALVGTCVGFLWFNSYPAQVFMGDTGSLCLGGIIASVAILVRKELLIPIFCGIFLVENLSVTLQVAYFKYTKKKYGEGRRIFLMSPLHHHYQKKGLHENKVVVRFWIVSVLLVILTILTLKVR